MVETRADGRYRDDAKVLAAIGVHCGRTELPDVEVHLPKALADAAVAAWRREEDQKGGPEDPIQRINRHRAGSLALIGLSIVNSGKSEGDRIIVGLQPGLIGDALSAADDPLLDEVH